MLYIVSCSVVLISKCIVFWAILQAMECGLADVRPLSTEQGWQLPALQLFGAFAGNQPLTMHVRRVCDDTRLMVTLEDPSSGAAGDVGSQLIKKHLAVSTAPTLVYSGSDQIHEWQSSSRTAKIVVTISPNTLCSYL